MRHFYALLMVMGGGWAGSERRSSTQTCALRAREVGTSGRQAQRIERRRREMSQYKRRRRACRGYIGYIP